MLNYSKPLELRPPRIIQRTTSGVFDFSLHA